MQLVKEFPALHGTRRFITALTSVRQLSLSYASPIQSIYPHPTSWRSILILFTHLRLVLHSGILPCGFPSKNVYNPSLHPFAPHSPHTINENSPPFLTNNMIFLHGRSQLKRLPFKCRCNHGESTLTIQTTPQPQKSHHQISTADLPANKQNNVYVMFSIQHIKYHIRILS